jgi:DNA-binding NtrC family response regulator
VPQQSPISFPTGTKNVLIIDGNEAMQNLRARVLRSRGVHVHTAKSVTEAELLWVPDFFDLVLLDVRQRSEEAVEFWRTIRRQHPGQRIRFLVGPPTYLSPPVPTKSSPATRFLKTGCRNQEFCMSHKALQTDSSEMETIDQGETSTKQELLTNRDTTITTHDEENVRARAYELYEVRGRIDGHAEEDWLQAESEVAGSNERKAVQASTSKITATIVGEA